MVSKHDQYQEARTALESGVAAVEKIIRDRDEARETRGAEPMIARLEVTRGDLTEYPLAEKVRAGWQNGVTFYPDEDVTQVMPLSVVAEEPEWEYGVRNTATSKTGWPWTRDEALKQAGISPMFEAVQRIRTEWVPVKQEGADDAQ